MQRSHRTHNKLITQIISLVLCQATLLAACAPTPMSDADSTAVSDHAIVNSAEAFDSGDDTYSLDGEGRVVLHSAGSLSPSVIADIRALSFIQSGSDTITYTARDGSIREYHASDRSETVIYDGGLATGAFAVHGDELWFIGSRGLYSLKKSGGSTLELEIDRLADLNMISSDEIILYAENENYIQEFSGAEDDYCDNDQYIAYLYSIKTGEAARYDENLENDGRGDNALDVSLLSATPLSESGSISINGVTYPFDDYPVNAFFTKNGRSCTCHNQGICVASGSRCNCMRYWPTGVSSTCQVDLLSSQCMGFARFCMWRTYGYFDAGAGIDKCYNAFGSKLSAGKWTPNTIKNCFTSVGPGGHLRTGSGHSLFVISVSSTGFITYECNRSSPGRYCLIFTRTWTWDTFFNTYGSRDMLYYNMPKNMSYQPPVEDEFKPGMYQTLASSLNMRSEPTTSSQALTQIPFESVLTVTETRKVGDYYWGRTTYNGYSGWVRLDYAVYISGKMTKIEITSAPSKTTYFEGDSFDTSGMEVSAFFSDGTSLAIQGYSCSGYNMSKAGTYTVNVTANGFSASFTITVRSKAVYPTSIALNYGSLVSIERDNYTVTAKLLPEDTTQRTIKWTSSNSDVASITSGGELSIKKAGQATITATTENNLTATVKITAIAMPTGTDWSVTASGDPLPALPDGIDPQDYSIRYQKKQSDGSWSGWIYENVPSDYSGEIRCQFRSFTVSFISDGKDIITPKAVDVNTYVDLTDYQLEKDGYLFAGWFSTNQAALSLDRDYAYGSKIRVTGDVTLYAGWIELSKVAPESSDPYQNSSDAFGLLGTALKVDSSGVGVRYFTRISNSLLSSIEKLHSDNQNFKPSSYSKTGIGYGTVMIAESALSGELRKPSSSASYLRDGSAMIIPAVQTYESYNGYIVYDALLTGFERADYTKSYVARPYITYKDANGFTHTYMPTYTGEGANGSGITARLSTLTDAAYESGDFMMKNMIEDYIYSVYRD